MIQQHRCVHEQTRQTGTYLLALGCSDDSRLTIREESDRASDRVVGSLKREEGFQEKNEAVDFSNREKTKVQSRYEKLNAE